MSEYKITSKIGAGAFGNVYLLRILTGARGKHKFALKVVDTSRLNVNEGECGNEGTLMLKLRHTHLVHCYDAFLCSPHLYLVMELCYHGSLEQLLHQQRSLVSEERVLTWMAQLADVLRYLHALKVIHRDLKPANVFLDQNQDVKLGDLGVARELDFTLQERQTSAGTLPYMSPEVFTGEPYNYKTDIWSLGCCIHEVMTLKKTFEGQNWPELYHMITSAKVPKMPSLYQRELKRLVLSLLDVDSTQRPDALEILLVLFQIQGKKFSSKPSQKVDAPPFDHRQICQVVKSYEVYPSNRIIVPLRPDSDDSSDSHRHTKQRMAQDSSVSHHDFPKSDSSFEGIESYKASKDSCGDQKTLDAFQDKQSTDRPRPLPVPRGKKKKNVLKSLKNKSRADQVGIPDKDEMSTLDKQNNDNTHSPRLSPLPVSDHTLKSSQGSIESGDDSCSPDLSQERPSDWTQQYMDTLAKESIQWLRSRFKPKQIESQLSASHSSNKNDDNDVNEDDDDSVDEDDDNVDDVTRGLVTLFTQSQTVVYINNKPTQHTSPDTDNTLKQGDTLLGSDLPESAMRAAMNTVKVFGGQDPHLLKLMLIKILGFHGFVLHGQHLLRSQGHNSTLNA